MTVPFVRADGGGREILDTVGSSGSTHTVDLADGNVHDVTLDDDCTFTFTGSVTSRACSFTLLLRQDGTGGHAVTWPGSVEWPGVDGTPALVDDAGALAILTFLTVDDGTTWLGLVAAGGEDEG